MNLRVTTLNLRYPSADGAHAWPKRRPAVRAVLRELGPDVLGTQEGRVDTLPQLDQVQEDLGETYSRVGKGRFGEQRDEHCAIFFRHDKMCLRHHGNFWLSETPEVPGSQAWDAAFPRMVTWAELQDLETEQVFTVFNTHLDHQSDLARRRGAQLLAKRVEAVRKAMPVIVMGDFNAPAETSAVYETLTQGAALVDAWAAAEQRTPAGGPGGTYHDFDGGLEGPRIDWILASTPVRVRRTWIRSEPVEGIHPSDHHPVTTELVPESG